MYASSTLTFYGKKYTSLLLYLRNSNRTFFTERRGIIFFYRGIFGQLRVSLNVLMRYRGTFPSSVTVALGLFL